MKTFKSLLLTLQSKDSLRPKLPLLCQVKARTNGKYCTIFVDIIVRGFISTVVVMELKFAKSYWTEREWG